MNAPLRPAGAGSPRVLFVTHSGEMGGAELFLLDVIGAGPAQWFAAVLGEGPVRDELLSAGRLLLGETIDLRAVRRDTRGPLALARGAIAGLRAGLQLAAARERYDVLCANSQKALLVCSVASALSGRPLVWILHDMIDGPSFSAPLRWGSVLLSRLFASRVVVNSHATERAFIRSGGQAAKTQVVYNGFRAGAAVDTAQAAVAIREEFGFDRRPIVGVFSRLAPWKGQDVLLKALARRPDVQGLIVGGALFGEGPYEATLLRLAAELGLAERVRFAGHRSDVAALMAGVDVVAHTSIEPEPFGRVVVEGQLSGRPVVASAAGGVVEIVRHDETGLLVEPGNADALADAIGRLVDDPTSRASLGTRGRQVASTQFRLDAVVEELSALLTVAARQERRTRAWEVSKEASPGARSS